MNEFCFEYEQTPWEATLDTLRSGDSISAARFLTLLEGEDEAYLEEAFLSLEENNIALNVAQLPKDYGTGNTEKRLRREEMLVQKGVLAENLDENDPLALYLSELASVPAAGDPQLLAQLYLEGDDSAAQRLLTVSVSRAVAAAQEMTGRGVLLLDLIQEANLGLWEGILHYTGGDFEAHADWWIRQYLAKAVVLQARQNGVATKMRRALEEFRIADKRLLTELGRNPTVEEIALELHISVEEAEVYQDMLRAARVMEQAKQPAREATAEDEQAVEDTAYFRSRQRILDMLSTLSELEARVLTLRFGLEGGQPCTPQQTGEKLGLTADRVVQLEAAALETLRKEG